jgi:glycosyltransferase involved in cell wall biosynthesis
VVAYGFPPLAGIGTQRPLRLLSHLDGLGWDLNVLTAKPSAYLPGTPTDDRLPDRWPASMNVVRTGAFRGLSKLGRLLTPLKARLRPSPTQPQGSPFGPMSAPSATAAPPPRPGLKKTVEELCAMPDTEVGWLLPAVVGGLRGFARTRPEVIYSTAPAWTSHLVASALAAAWRCPWVADFRDPWVRSPWNRYTTPTALAMGARLERWVVRRADAVLFTTETACQEFAAHYGPDLSEKFHVVSNGCDPLEMTDAPSGPLSVVSDRIPSGEPNAPTGPFVLLHAGTLYGGRSPVPVISAVARLCAQDPSVRQRLRVRFLGASNPPGSEISRLRDELGLQTVVEFLPRVGRRESLEQMRKAGALLILQAGLTLAIPGKLYEYFAAGRPVLALCDPGEMADIIRSNKAGLVADPSSEAAVAAAIATLVNGFERGWTRPSPALYDGRLRAAEMTAILESVVRRRVEASRAPAAGVREA